jgi:branched-chain amino acid transport system permease protein
VTAFLQLVASGVSVGAAYALVGLGLVLVFRTTNALNFSQGAYAVLAGLTTARLAFDIPTPLAALAAIGMTAGVGLVVGFVALGRRGHTTPLVSLIITLGLALVIVAVELVIFGEQPRTYARISRRAWGVGGVLIQPQYVLILVVTVAATVLLTLLLRHTIVGNALVACSDSARAAQIVGLDVRTLGALSFTIAAVLGAVAGVLLIPLVPMTPYSDVTIAVNGFAAGAFGGLVSIPATLAGGLVLGVAEKLVVGYVNPQYELAIALVIMLVIIGWRSRREALTT